MNDLTDAIYIYVDRDGNVEPASDWSEEDLRKLIKAAKQESKRRAVPTSEKQP